MTPPEHVPAITLPSLSWKICKELLQIPGWATTLKLVFIGGRLDEEDRIKLPIVSAPLPPDLDRAICDQELTFEFSPSEREAIQIAIKFGVSHGCLPATRYSKLLIQRFGIEIEK